MSNFLPCPFCGGAVSKCDESPLYGGSIMHDETECLFKNNLLFHGNIAERWNSRPIEDALRSRIAELEALLKLVTPELNSTDVLSAVQEIFQLRWKDRIAELEKDKIRLANEYCELAQVWQEHKCKPDVVWHRYPEEKPGKTGYYIIHYTILNRVAFDFWQTDKSQWDKYGEYITHWTYMPASPEEGE
jgi:hypothetical protein